MKALNKQALREAAEKATPGPWRYLKTTPFMDAEISAENHTRVVNLLAGDVTADNSDFIAAANPATVLALLDELEAADRINAHYRTRLDRLERRCNHQGSVYWDASGVKRCAGCGIDATGIGVKGE
ncbi:ead/Ea22-like family protein [Salmonella enterica subsp. enterica]|nr:ead/Ea22-like family protein [Salmonella enterica subsp. enterica]